MTPEEIHNLAWNHILEGDYAAAIAIYEHILQPGKGPWGGYGTALLLRGDAVAAEEAFRQTCYLPNAHRRVNPDIGVAIWCQGKPEEACAEWQQELHKLKSTEIRYDVASGLFLAALLWWASLHLDKPEATEAALAELRLMRTWDDQKEPWGMVLAAAILGEITPDEFLLEAAETPDLEAKPLSIRQSRRVTQCFFYLAARFPPHSLGWKDDLNAAVRYGTPQGITKSEYLIARYELLSE